MNAVAVSGGLKQWLNLWVVNFQSLKLNYEKEPIKRDEISLWEKNARFLGKLFSPLPYILMAFIGVAIPTGLLQASFDQWPPILLFVAALFGVFLAGAGTFFFHSLDLIIKSVITAFMIAFSIFSPVIFYLIWASAINLGLKCLLSILAFLFAFSGIYSLLMLPALIKVFFKTLAIDNDRQAHFLFVASMALLGWGLWLQNGGNWQGMAALNIPFVLPLLDWSIPWTESIGFPFALLGYVHDPAGAVVSGIAQAHSGEIVALLGAATLLLLFAKAQLKNAGTPLHPALPLLTLALLLASVCLDIALHWSGAPVLPPALILFNRAFAVLALGVLVFWWGNIPIGGETVPGAENDLGIARGQAAMRALKVCFWCVALVFVMTAASHFSGEWRHGIRLILVGLWMVPARMAINFPNDYRDDLQQYRKAKQMWEQSYSPARIVPTKAEIDSALGD